MSLVDKIVRLIELCTIMNVPRNHLLKLSEEDTRQEGLRWLSENLATKNYKHELFQEARELVSELLKVKERSNDG